MALCQRPTADAMTIISALQAEFPDVDLENIEETLDACSGDVGKCAAVLRDMLDEEAAEGAAATAPSTFLRSLLDAVTQLAEIPAAEQPESSRRRIMNVCADLEASGVHLTQPVASLLDGSRNEQSLTAGLDEADAEVVRQMLALLEYGGALPNSELTETEQRDLVVGYGTSSERSELETELAAKQADLAKKNEAVDLLKRAVIKQRLGAEGAVPVAK